MRRAWYLFANPWGKSEDKGLIELAQATWEGGCGYEMGDSRRKNVPMEPSAEQEACRQP